MLPRRPTGPAFRVLDLRDRRPLDLIVLPSGVVSPDRIAERVERLRNLWCTQLARTVDYVTGPDGSVGILFEPTQGMTLPDRLRNGALSVSEAVHVLDGVLSALATCHDIGVVHRDVRPGNVRVVEGGRGAPPWVVLHGAGLAWILSDRSAAALGKVVYGHPQFTAPEQWVDRRVDARTDLYAVGLLGYLMLQGRNLVSSGAPMDACRQHATAPRPLLARSVAQEPVPRSLADALRTASDPLAGRRHSNAESMRTALVTTLKALPAQQPRLKPVEFDEDALTDVSLNITFRELETIVSEFEDEDTLLDLSVEETLLD